MNSFIFSTQVSDMMLQKNLIPDHEVFERLLVNYIHPPVSVIGILFFACLLRLLFFILINLDHY